MPDDRTYVKVHDGMPDHPKFATVGGDAAWLWLCGTCYCSRHLTDGKIPKAVLPRLSDRRAPEKLAAQLVAVGLWHDRGDHYEVHDYTEHQRSAAEVRQLKEKRRDAGARGGKAKANGLASAKQVLEQSPQQPGSKSLPVSVSVSVPEQPMGETAPDEQARPPKRASQLPSSWDPNEKHFALASERSLDVVAEVDQFRDFHLAKGSTFKDWDAAFRTWLRNSDRFASPTRTLRMVNGSEPPRPRDVPDTAVFMEGTWVY